MALPTAIVVLLVDARHRIHGNGRINGYFRLERISNWSAAFIKFLKAVERFAASSTFVIQ